MDGRGESCGGCVVASQYSYEHAPCLQATLRLFRGQRTPDERAPRSEDTWWESPTALNVCSICLISEVEKTAQRIKKISGSLVLLFCYSCYSLAHFFNKSVRVCVCVCVCVCCIGRDSEKDGSLLWLEQQNAVIFNYIKSICLKVNKTLSTKKKKPLNSVDIVSLHCHTDLLFWNSLRFFPESFHKQQTHLLLGKKKKKEFMGLPWWSSVKTLHFHCRRWGFAHWLQS